MVEFLYFCLQKDIIDIVVWSQFDECLMTTIFGGRDQTTRGKALEVAPMKSRDFIIM